ncbi:4-hydroxybenzoate octaprenyltransferase [Psychromonas sp. B3M02]|uniref:4-hydroxybenzoate octaprenyltransferase n=1 Tax=Psychromonas sp. B3M02 TaxID=2267226 RepID=UPI000DE8C640|nr:4-hydroxybenzoate octaprenyltransferase [Psychromonas sp. B3M02]RBW45101.1 4-hydroxybenzoate octaprenyltransferase [Psychromonas sp. B3M02]
MISYFTATKRQAFLDLMRTDKPIGTLLLLWPTLWALWVAAAGLPNLGTLLVFCIGVFVMRSAGCVINDFADRKLDGFVERTKNRPLPSGRATSKEAVILFLTLALFAFLLVLTQNTLTIQLSLIGLLLAFIYPFMKRFTNLPQVFLGLAFSWSIPMAYAAQANQLDSVIWLLFIANLTWTVAYDTMYGMVDKEDDLKIGVKSTAILFGKLDKVIIASLQLITLGILLSVGILKELNSFYYIALVIVSGLFIHQQYSIRDRQRANCFKAFLDNNYVGLIIFVGLFLAYL